MSYQKAIDQNDWPRRPGRGRRRASAEGAVQRLRTSRRRGWLIRVFLMVAIVTPTVFVSSPFYAAYASRLPDIDQVMTPMPSDSIVYASDGATVLADLHPPGYQHFQEPLSAMGHNLPDAMIAIEDHNFYNEPGVDPTAVVRAFTVNMKSQDTVQGASSLTQQLVKIRLIGNAPTLDRKVREALLSLQIAKRYSKSQILEAYLNSVSFGNSAIGASAAAQIYFHKKTSELDVAQAAMLAGIVKGPTLYNPFLSWAKAKARQQVVLEAMVRNGMLTEGDAGKAYGEDLRPPAHMFVPANQVVAPGFVSYVTNELVQQFGADMTYGGGLKVITTLDMRVQQIGQAAITGTQQRLAWRNVQQGALVAIDPASGGIIAMVGSANPGANGGQYNLAVWPPRNPGSSMKIFTYTAAIASGRYTMTTSITDSAISIPDGTGVWRPRNYDGKYHGTMQLQQAMGNSLNIPAVKVELGVGVQNVVSLARSMGAPPWRLHDDGTETNDDPLNTYGPSLTLGGYGETPLQMATGASVLAAGGVLHQPFAVARVDQGGKTIYKHTDAPKSVLDPKVAFIMASIMANDANHAMIFGRNTDLVVRGYHVAVKTGTSDSFADAWTIGFTPHIAVAVWMGNPDWRLKMTKGSDSFYVAVPAWHSFLAQTLPLFGGDAWYSPPAGIVQKGGNYFLPGTVK